MKAKVNWKPVTLSGTTGILMGAGTVFATQHHSDAEDLVADTSARLREVTADDSQSFKHAFDEARAELGPGGVFTWRGNIYNTYTADEWDAMSEEEKKDFAQQVNPEVSPEDIDTAELEETAGNEDVVEVTEDTELEDGPVFAEVSGDSESDVNIVNDNEDVAMAAYDHDTQVDDQTDDDDVRIIGYGEVDLANGRSVAVQELEINGQRVAVIDVDKDGVGDIAMSDLNHNQHADDGEIVDLHTGEALAFNNQAQTDDAVADMDLSMVDF